ncbi:MAG TPA: hypothetical protein ENF93_01655, partial [Ignisphaera sp.]|nr:hypothetical protein [Ignisphaera sp.]
PRLSYALRSISRRASNIEELLEYIVKIVDSSAFEEIEILKQIADAYRSNRIHIEYSEDAAYLLTEEIDFNLGEKRLYMTAYVPPFLVQKYELVKVEDLPTKVSTSIDTSISSRYRERSPEFIHNLCEIVIHYIDKHVANLVVVPSKNIAEELSKCLLRKGYRIAPPQIIDRVDSGTIVIDAAGGIATEGITPSKALKRVIVAGMPYPSPSPQLNLLAKIYGFDNVYTYIALLRTVQAVGRLMRWGGEAILIDRRYKYYINRMPSWIEIKNII